MPDKPTKPPRWPVQPALTHGRDLYNGLVGLWPIWEGGGLTVADLSPNGLDGTLIGGPSWVQSRGGHALSLDGIDNYVERADESALDITGEITLLAWINIPNNPTGTREGILGKYRNQSGQADQRAYNLDLRTSGKIGGTVSSDGTFGEGSTSNAVDGDIVVVDGTWHQVVMAFIPSTSITVYADGVEDVTNTTSIVSSIFNSPAPLWLGLTFDSTVADRYLEGFMDLVTIWNRALTPGEIAFLAAFPFAMIEPRGGKLGIAGRR